jgi:phage baseplate assembly protein W
VTLVHKKIQAVVSQFIDSAIPPALQISIPSELAQKIRQWSPTAGTYLIREAQVGIIKLLCYLFH